ncbi:glycerophosphodiester phosphodiesterase [Paenibacillus riograndensis]|uniref:Glycerophosphoryl diester phosphodiesterase n=1 Tax=Paenibacillus riograndensis SBR5 TaxID=1073571 RepID=A0A0E4H726_9BACL|nr:glycerophosphodiester phosphodiesterase [Paenibacillus riograndensis]CQR51646.1 glycerophosphoryl diester phosphodiesterase [Paenibacillus riograndensis SBR5]
MEAEERKPFPFITAHTGCMETLDNTLDAVRMGIELGADIVEDDVRVTKDGIAVMAHDDIWTTAAGRSISISETNFTELKNVEVAVDYAGKQGSMTFSTLEEMLRLIKPTGTIANLDLKVDEAVDAAAELVHSLDMLEQVFLSGCEKERALLAQRRQPQLRKLLNADIRLFRTLPYEFAVEQTCREALEASCFGINIYHEVVTPWFMERARASGLPVYVWTVNETQLMEHYADLGVASITARNVQALADLKQARANEA